MKEIIIAITGASCVIYGIRLLQVLADLNVNTHLILSKAACTTILIETNFSILDVKKFAHKSYANNEISAAISSGSFKINGMIVAPCSMKTLSAIANGYENDLISRAAMVTLKEKRLLALMVRESPLNSIHLENMLKLSKIGVAIAPPMPAFYNKPDNIDDLINHSVSRILDLFSIETNLCKRWHGHQALEK